MNERREGRSRLQWDKTKQEIVTVTTGVDRESAAYKLGAAEEAIRRLRKALKPLADIPLEHDSEPSGLDHIAAVDMRTTPNEVRFARLVLSQTANYA